MKFPFRIAVPLLAAAAFLAVCATFAVQLFSFRANIERWARRDLSTQAELTAESLREPLATQDFRRLDEIARRLKAKEMILRVRSAQGGWIFHGGYKGGTIEEYVPCGEYRVGVALREGRVMAPFYNALAGFVLAVLVSLECQSAWRDPPIRPLTPLLQRLSVPNPGIRVRFDSISQPNDHTPCLD